MVKIKNRRVITLWLKGWCAKSFSGKTQPVVLRLGWGFDNYGDELFRANLKSLEERGVKLCKIFAIKCMKRENPKRNNIISKEKIKIWSKSCINKQTQKLIHEIPCMQNKKKDEILFRQECWKGDYSNIFIVFSSVTSYFCPFNLFILWTSVIRPYLQVLEINLPHCVDD